MDRLAPMRADARAIAAAVMRAVDAAALTARAFALPGDGAGRVRVIGAGKASVAMAAAIEAALGARLYDGLIVAPEEPSPGRLARVEVRIGSHPLPDARSEAAGRALLDRVAGGEPDDVWIGLWSGGASALIEVPRPDTTLHAIAAATAEAVRAGVAIGELNALRRGWSAIKGGGLARAGPGRWQNYVLSDVSGDDPALVGSGPGIRDDPRDSVVIVGSSRTAVDAAVAEAFALRYVALVLDPDLAGEARHAGERLAHAIAALPEPSPPMALILAGEPVVSGVPAGAVGGRMQALALAAAIALARLERPVVVLATSTDGRDGASDAAGALVDNGTVRRGSALGLDAGRALADHASTAYLDAAGDTLRTGPTGTNVRDVVVALVR